MAINPDKIRRDFPIFDLQPAGQPLVYLDNAATSLVPQAVIEAVTDFYRRYKSNVHRGIHRLSVEATERYEAARAKIARLIGADPEEIIFTSGTTESLNLLANILAKNLKPGDEIVLTQLEHHSNLVPWQVVARQTGSVLKFIKINEGGRLNLDQAREVIGSKTKLVSLTQMSNVLGTINQVREIADLAHEQGALVIVDGAQSVPHFRVEVKSLHSDFLAFSGHKMLGPTGIGVLYGKRELLDKFEPFKFGGGMISEVSFLSSGWAELPWKFEAGTPNIAGAIGLGAAVDYLESLGFDQIQEQEEKLVGYTLEKLSAIKGIQIYGPKTTKDRGGVIAFNVKGLHPHDLATILDRDNIAIRTGNHCAMPLHGVLGAASTCRLSLYLYNNQADIAALVAGVIKAKKIFRL